MPEWLNGLAWNASMRVTVSGVRISFSPQNFAFKMFDFLQKTLLIMAILLNKLFSNTIILYRPNKAQYKKSFFLPVCSKSFHKDIRVHRNIF